jgi:hypothetical protein
MRRLRTRYRRPKASEWHHVRTPDTLTPSALPAQRDGLDRVQSLILILVAPTDRRQSDLVPPRQTVLNRCLCECFGVATCVPAERR